MEPLALLISISPQLRVVLDVLDILLFVGLLYLLYRLLKGTIAINIFFGLLIFYLFWWVVKALDMKLLSTVLGQFIGVGVIALLIVFQQEIRRFFLWLGRNISIRNPALIFQPWKWSYQRMKSRQLDVKQIAEALTWLSERKLGALIVLCTGSELRAYAETGTVIEARLKAGLLKSIFCKGAPLHDGATIICHNSIVAAACILPLSEQPLPPQLGLRHRAALGISEHSDAIAIVVSEETGHIGIAHQGHLRTGITIYTLRQILSEHFIFHWEAPAPKTPATSARK